MYYCNECGKTFGEPNTVETTYEDFYGVGHLFEDSNLLILETCPFCGEVNSFELMEYCDNCTELFKESDLVTCYKENEDSELEYVGTFCENCIKILDKKSDI